MINNLTVYLISRIRGKVHRMLENELRESGIDELVVSQGSILTALYSHGGKLPMKDIATLIRRDKSTITYLVTRLEQKGYVRKEKNERDSRMTHICLTEKAWHFEDRFAVISRRMSQMIYQGLTPEEAALLEHLLEKVDQNIRNGAEENGLEEEL